MPYLPGILIPTLHDFIVNGDDIFSQISMLLIGVDHIIGAMIIAYSIIMLQGYRKLLTQYCT